ncbi:ligase-associated DNA damage response DEXH box helicase [Robbsia sp. Bb-Pol-6]|uniref:Ligase-associated DNA damage response DEXH box helicase n=1 Tax=Robbsia betulipollinis TaxID=2981849 RepID=A0ABT3ZN30_9BURK|nr:ligase-associated DNA damage response DEXH box helicase [Robbsia betulipollinis]MCY0387817.1 ligase-associated DNA damage response DEXH box helicase [Robbsia betulipollinis]
MNARDREVEGIAGIEEIGTGKRAARGAGKPLNAWFRTRGWRPFPFQRDVWERLAAGDSGLLHATTGAGKTFAVWLGAILAYGGDQALTAPDAPAAPAAPVDSPAATPPASAAAARAMPAAGRRPRAVPAPPLTVLWITPMRALAADTARALNEPLEAIGSRWRVGLRTGDTPAAERARQDRRLPTALVTTPESLSLLLTRAAAHDTMAGVRLVVVDEWHELLGSKRGVQVQLALARLAQWQPALQVWGLSATLGDLDLARDALLAAVRTPTHLVRGLTPKKRLIDTLIPDTIERFPWAGHLGTRLVAAVAAEIDRSDSALVFTNTRAQAEIWYQALLDQRPDWAGVIALHHGSLDSSVRGWVETALKTGKLRAVVCTSSLDLGVDFAPVDRVFQVGSPKGIARLLQRAGRSGHSPGRASRITLVPTHALELVEAAAARHAVELGRIESRAPPEEPLDVLVQHLVTVALGGGFTADALLAEVRRAWSFRTLSAARFQWALAFVEHGGGSLGAYPDYHRIAPDAAGVYHVPRADLARRHRANIGTIVADAAMRIEWVSGGRIGTVDEAFVSRLRPGDAFTFAGRTVELVRVREMTAYVKRAAARRGTVPQWQGGRMPLSSELANSVIELLGAVGAGDAAASGAPEMRAIAPLLALQRDWSQLPRPGVLLIETLHTREGWHFFCYPFAGRTAHLGLASLLAWRAAQRAPRTFSISMNDYGFELLSATPVDWPALIADGLLAETGLEADVLASLNASELASRRFREIARIAGLIFQSHPGEGRSARQLQASAGLFYQVFAKHDPGNLLLEQARNEILLEELDIGRLHDALQRIARGSVAIETPAKPTPFAFPLMVGRLRERISTEQLADRVQRMLADLERAAGPEPSDPAAPVRAGRASRRAQADPGGASVPDDRPAAGAQSSGTQPAMLAGVDDAPDAHASSDADADAGADADAPGESGRRMPGRRPRRARQRRPRLRPF